MKKKIIISVIVVLIIIVCIKPAQMIYQYFEKIYRLSQDAYYTEYRLTYDELFDMFSFYGVNTNPHYMLLTKGNEECHTDWPDFSYCEMEASEITEMNVAVLNYDLFFEPSELDEAACVIAEGYGFSKENPITVEWVMEHPREAIEIVSSTFNRGTSYRGAQEFRYNQIFGPLPEESTE